MKIIKINGIITVVPAGAIAYDHAIPIEGDGWIYDVAKRDEIYNSDPSRIIDVPEKTADQPRSTETTTVTMVESRPADLTGVLVNVQGVAYIAVKELSAAKFVDGLSRGYTIDEGIVYKFSARLQTESEKRELKKAIEIKKAEADLELYSGAPDDDRQLDYYKSRVVEIKAELEELRAI